MADEVACLSQQSGSFTGLGVSCAYETLLFLRPVRLYSVSRSPTAELLKAGNAREIQDREMVQRLYGGAVREVYRASKNLTVTASFAPTGSLCQACIASDLDSGITDKELKPALDQLAPREVRGKFKIATFLDTVCLKFVKPENPTSNSTENSAMKVAVDPCRECSGVSEDYERVKITRYGNTNQYSSVHITYLQPECKRL